MKKRKSSGQIETLENIPLTPPSLLMGCIFPPWAMIVIMFFMIMAGVVGALTLYKFSNAVVNESIIEMEIQDETPLQATQPETNN